MMAYDKYHKICLSAVFSMFIDSLLANDTSGYVYTCTKWKLGGFSQIWSYMQLYKQHYPCNYVSL